MGREVDACSWEALLAGTHCLYISHLQVSIEDAKQADRHQTLQNRFILKFEPNRICLYCMNYMQVNTIKIHVQHLYIIYKIFIA